MTKTYRNTNNFSIIIGSFTVLPGETIGLVGYNGSMLVPVADERPTEDPIGDEKPKRARKAAAEPASEPATEPEAE